MGDKRTILVVESDAIQRTRMAGWLEEEGFDVLLCPGPRAPEYTCLGSRGKRCPLMQPADAVVLDLSLEGDAMLLGTPAWQLLYYYLAHHKNVVLLVGEGDAMRPFPDARLALVQRPAERRQLLGAVKALLAPLHLVLAGGTVRGEDPSDGHHPAR